MAHYKSYTTVEQSHKLAEILSLESADGWWIALNWQETEYYIEVKQDGINKPKRYIPCWSLTALLKYISEIKPQVYTPTLFPSEGKWILQFVEYGHGNICEGTCDNPVDACYEIILKLHELKIL